MHTLSRIDRPGRRRTVVVAQITAGPVALPLNLQPGLNIAPAACGVKHLVEHLQLLRQALLRLQQLYRRPSGGDAVFCVPAFMKFPDSIGRAARR